MNSAAVAVVTVAAALPAGWPGVGVDDLAVLPRLQGLQSSKQVQYTVREYCVTPVHVTPVGPMRCEMRERVAVAHMTRASWGERPA